jgi:hypothetical protein
MFEGSYLSDQKLDALQTIFGFAIHYEGVAQADVSPVVPVDVDSSLYQLA